MVSLFNLREFSDFLFLEDTTNLSAAYLTICFVEAGQGIVFGLVKRCTHQQYINTGVTIEVSNALGNFISIDVSSKSKMAKQTAFVSAGICLYITFKHCFKLLYIIY